MFDSCTFGNNTNFLFEQAIDNYFITPRFTTLPVFNNRYLGTQSCTHYVNSITMGLSNGVQTPDINGGYVEVNQAGSNQTFPTGAATVVDFNTVVRNAITNDLSFTYLQFWDAATKTFKKFSSLKSPNADFFVDVDIALSIGGAGVTMDYSKLSVYLYDVALARPVAYLTPSVEFFGANPGNSWKIYTLQGRIAKKEYQLVVSNNSGVTATGYRQQTGNIPFTAKFGGF